MYLSSPLVQAYLSEQATGTTISVMKTADIKELPVPLQTSEEQGNVVQTYNKILDSYNKIHKIKQGIELLSNTHWSLQESE